MKNKTTLLTVGVASICLLFSTTLAFADGLCSDTKTVKACGPSSGGPISFEIDGEEFTCDFQESEGYIDTCGGGFKNGSTGCYEDGEVECITIVTFSNCSPRSVDPVSAAYPKSKSTPNAKPCPGDI